MGFRLLLGLALLATLLAAHVASVSALGKQYRWDTIAVDLAIQANGDVLVEERQTFRFTQGRFTHAHRDIRLDRLDRIVDPQVREGERTYRPGSGQPDTIASSTEGGKLRIEWWFEPTENTTRTFTVAYRVLGAIRRGEQADQLWWSAIGSDRGQPVGTAIVTIRFPGPIGAEQLALAASGARAGDTEVVDDRTIRFYGERVEPSDSFDVRVQFPSGLVGGDPPAWQATTGLLREAEEARAAVDFSMLATALLLLIGGLALLAIWIGCLALDPGVGITARILDEPPSNLSPGLVGTLLDERVDQRDVLAVVLELARRDFLRIEELPWVGTGPDGRWARGRDFRFIARPGDGRRLRSHESAILGALLDGKDVTRLRHLGRRFSLSLPTIRDMMYGEIVAAGLAPTNPERVRRRARIGGAVLAACGLCLAVPAWLVLEPVTDLGALPPLALAVVGLAIGATAPLLPRRTREGSLQAARWRAFRKHLARVARGGERPIGSERFERYLPYAVAFGLQDSWLDELVRGRGVEAGVAPHWYARGPLLGDVDVDVEAASGAIAELPKLTMASLSDLGRGLDQLSDGLAGMLDEASCALAGGAAESVAEVVVNVAVNAAVSAASGGGGGGAD